MQERPSTAMSVLRVKHLCACLGLSRSTIYDRINPESKRYDETFPKQFKLGGTAVGWSEDAIQKWLSGCLNK
jgi:prophage regulatory protein